MITRFKFILPFLILSVLGLNTINAQEEEEVQESKTVEGNSEKAYQKLAFYDLRGTNSVDVSFGSALLGGDFPDPEFEFYLRFAYKRHVTEHLALSLSFNRYNLAFNEIYNQAFMSFDFNLEYFMTPFNGVSPFVFAGYGYNADSGFETTGPKVQGGLGVEFMVVEKVGIKLFGEYNYVFSKETSPIINNENSINFLRLGLGVNLYFGGEKAKAKLQEQVETVIKTNTIE